MVDGFKCMAYGVCDSLGNARGGCGHIATPKLDRETWSIEKRVDDISIQLVLIQACLASIVRLLSRED